jgi:DNA invertase Pin-like site-specific DNA recombinase
MTTKQAFAYIRVSGIGQQKGHGPKRQKDIIKTWASKHHYSIAITFEDAHTGTDADRPEFNRMLADMMGNGVKIVIVESLDRLARDLMIQSTLLAKLAAENLTLIAANTGEDVTASIASDPMRKALVQIQGVFAELDKSLLVRKLRKARDAASLIKGHRVEGPAPYGKDPKRPHEAEVVAIMRKHHRDGRSLAWIARYLNANNMPSRKRPWSKMTVHSVLSRIHSKKGGRKS